MAAYKKCKGDEWVKPIMTGYKVACCDCGLVHVVNFKIVKGEVEFQVFRDNRATAQKRRFMKQSINNL